jgi:putative effector of murein hydrolase LrgA (UPF0299 family)
MGMLLYALWLMSVPIGIGELQFPHNLNQSMVVTFEAIQLGHLCLLICCGMNTPFLKIAAKSSKQTPTASISLKLCMCGVLLTGNYHCKETG